MLPHPICFTLLYRQLMAVRVLPGEVLVAHVLCMFLVQCVDLRPNVGVTVLKVLLGHIKIGTLVREHRRRR